MKRHVQVPSCPMTAAIRDMLTRNLYSTYIRKVPFGKKKKERKKGKEPTFSIQYMQVFFDTLDLYRNSIRICPTKMLNNTLKKGINARQNKRRSDIKDISQASTLLCLCRFLTTADLPCCW